jgi:8-oxo-dGTP diphosphatase
LAIVWGDGDGWILAGRRRFWGRYGAAGLLLRAPAADSSPLVLLQHRAMWSHQGGTWALPGGALNSGENPENAALREAAEEAGLQPALIRVVTKVVTARVPGDCGTVWTYSTVVAEAREPLPTVPNAESAELRWVPEHEVADLPLHPGFAQSWPGLWARDPAPPHEDCRDLPHTVKVAERTFAWCRPGR